jgi:two-component system sensor histidine kinase VicK
MNAKKEQGLDCFLVDITKRGIIVFGPQGEIARSNAAAEKIISCLTGGNIVLCEEDLLTLLKIAPLAPETTNDSLELDASFKSTSISRQRLEVGNSQHIAYFLQDISGEKTLISTLYRQTSDSLWEIRSRITSVQNAIAMLVDFQKEDLNEETMELLVDSRYEIWRLTRYMDCLRDLTLLNANILDKKLDMEDIDCVELLQNAFLNINAFKANWNKKYFLIDATARPWRVRCDKQRTLRIIESILFNAIVYSNAQVTVTVTIEETGAGDVALHIEDNGIGIPAADQPRLFEYGFRAENGFGLFPNGSGISLHVARQVLNRMDGGLSFISKENTGSIFTISLKKTQSK